MHVSSHPLDGRRLDIDGAAVVGGGPAAIGLLLAAARTGALRGMLAGGLTIVERGPAIGAGSLGSYAVSAESDARAFLDAVRGHPVASVARLIDCQAGRALAAFGNGAGADLTAAAAFLDAVGAELTRIVRLGGGRVLSGHEAMGATRTEGGWRLRLRRLDDGAILDLAARNLVIAAGGQQPRKQAGEAMFAGVSLSDRCGARLVGSDELLRHGGVERLARRLERVASPRVAIVGGGSSAFSAAISILRSPLGFRLPEGGLTILHRRAPRPWHASVEAARADGFDGFGPDDVCPVTGEVFRLAGLRGEARALLSGAAASAEPRLRLHRARPDVERRSLHILAEADVVVAAVGYRPRGLDLRDADGTPIALAAAGAGGAAMVDSGCRVLDSGGAPLPGVFGAGLAAGFAASAATGGEPSFRGQANGLWLWQAGAGEAIARRLAESDPGEKPISRADPDAGGTLPVRPRRPTLAG